MIKRFGWCVFYTYPDGPDPMPFMFWTKRGAKRFASRFVGVQVHRYGWGLR